MARAISAERFSEDGWAQDDWRKKHRVHAPTDNGDSLLPLCGQRAVDVHVAEWAARWGEGLSFTRSWPADVGLPLERPNVARLRRTIRRFKTATGLSWDGIPPPSLGTLIGPDVGTHG